MMMSSTVAALGQADTQTKADLLQQKANSGDSEALPLGKSKQYRLDGHAEEALTRRSEPGLSPDRWRRVA